MANRSVIKNAQKGQYNSLFSQNSLTTAQGNQLVTDLNSVTLSANVLTSQAGTNVQAETLMFAVPYDGLVSAIYYTPASAVTASATLYYTVTVKKRDASGANATTIWTFDTTPTGSTGGTGNLTQWDPIVGYGNGSSLSGGLGVFTDSAKAVVQGGCMTVTVGKSDITTTGVTAPVANLMVVMEVT